MTEDGFRNEGRLEFFKNRLAHHTAQAGALVAFMQSAIRASFMLNGGAIIAIVSIYGALKGDVSTAGFSAAIGWWVAGLIDAALAVFLIGWAQRQFQAIAGQEITTVARDWYGAEVDPGDPPDAWFGQALRVLAIVAWLTSLAAFVAGAYAVVPAVATG